MKKKGVRILISSLEAFQKTRMASGNQALSLAIWWLCGLLLIYVVVREKMCYKSKNIRHNIFRESQRKISVKYSSCRVRGQKNKLNYRHES